MAHSKMLPRESQSSLPYQILLYLNGWYLAAFLVVEVFLLVFKTSVLPYPAGNIVAEVFLLIFLGGIESVRIFMGKKGNLTERIISLVLSMIFTAPSVLAMLYLLLWQTYVLRLEVILLSIGLVFEGIELLFALLAVVTISKAGG
ncbi:Transmembrane protein 216-like [Homarus americanus]|uniref:Transmembrane protein 216-like n=1 Tax=Homarus americanus TaxID=6706 RepID=A0A8J5JX65_HOMAM|nr:Transmembrane protein 216-like [Homarus americanus]